MKRCRELDILLVYDNAYSEMAFDGYVPPSIFEIDGAREVAIEFHSMSKTYNMTGWRCGWAVGAKELVAPLAKVKPFVDTGAFMAVQAASAAALDDAGDFSRGTSRRSRSGATRRSKRFARTAFSANRRRRRCICGSRFLSTSPVRSSLSFSWRKRE